MTKRQQQATLLSFFGKLTPGKGGDNAARAPKLPKASRQLYDGKNAVLDSVTKDQITIKTKLQENEGDGPMTTLCRNFLTEQCTSTQVVSPQVKNSNLDTNSRYSKEEDPQHRVRGPENWDVVGEEYNDTVTEPNGKKSQLDIKVYSGSVNDLERDVDADSDHGDDDSDMTSAIHVETLSDPDQKSEYELFRERNIARNMARLKALGLMVKIDDASAGEKRRRTGNSAKKKKRTASEVLSNDMSLPSRRSTRLRKSAVPSEDVPSELYDDNGKKGNTIASHIMVENIEEFTVSPVVDYDIENFCKSEIQRSGRNDGPIQTLVPFGPRLVPPSGLHAIYSLQYFSSSCEKGSGDYHVDAHTWLVGAGKSGLTALWDVRRGTSLSSIENGIEPVISWKSHGGRWIADARFLPNDANSKTYSPNRLVTAGNDGTVCLWDLTSMSVKTGAPKLLFQTTKSLHSSGIFSMDVHVKNSTEIYISTGSKDKTIAMTDLNRLSYDPLWKSNFHSAKVGSVSFSSSASHPLIASASDDGSVAIHDNRTNGMTGTLGVVAHLKGPHYRPHTVVWKSCSNTEFMTAGLDDVIKLWDLRNTSKTIASFHGHVPLGRKKLKRIHRPVFLNAHKESFVLSGGEGSNCISLFQLDSNNGRQGNLGLHTVYSRGKLPPDIVGDTGSIATHGCNISVALEGGEVLMLSPNA